MNKKILFSLLDGIIVMGLGICILVGLNYHRIPPEMMRGLENPVLFPKLMGWVLIMLAAVLIITNLFKMSRDNKESSNFQPKNFSAIVFAMAIIALYVLLIPILGFYIATVAGILGLVYITSSMSKRKVKWYKALLYSIICSTIMWLIFVEFLKIPLPK